MSSSEIVGTIENLGVTLITAPKPFYAFWTVIDWIIVFSGFVTFGLWIGITLKEKRLHEQNEIH